MYSCGVLTLILFYVPDILQRGLDIHLPDTLEIIVLVFIFAAEILGEIQAFYIRIPIWGHDAAYDDRFFWQQPSVFRW